MDNVMRILTNRHLSLNKFFELILVGHPDCGLMHHHLLRPKHHERKMPVDEAILFCGVLGVPLPSHRR